MPITGDPGIGKSAIVAEMVEHCEKMGVIAWFCCRWEQPDQLAPRVFVEAIAASLAEHLPAYTPSAESHRIAELARERPKPVERLDRARCSSNWCFRR
jgi:hypothetical protein